MNVYVAETKINRGSEQKKAEQSESNIFLFVLILLFLVLFCLALGCYFIVYAHAVLT